MPAAACSSAPRLPRPLLRMNAPAEMRGAISDRVMGRGMGHLTGRQLLSLSTIAPITRGGNRRPRAAGTPRRACHYDGVAHTSASAGALLRHVRTGRARSRADLVALTGASRNTVSARVDQLIAANLLEEG